MSSHIIGGGVSVSPVNIRPAGVAASQQVSAARGLIQATA